MMAGGGISPSRVPSIQDNVERTTNHAPG